MARQKPTNGAGPNRAAVDEMVAGLEEDGLLSRVDRVAVEHARSLASAVDGNPGSSQLAMQFRGAIASLRKAVDRSEADAGRELIWRVQTGCDLHVNGPVHCEACCPSMDGLAEWEPPPRSVLEGRTRGQPQRHVTDADYVRYAVRAWLSER